MRNCIVYGNKSTKVAGGGGGGIALRIDSADADIPFFVIENCKISNNKAADDGGGIRIASNTPANIPISIEGCEISGNITSSGKNGGGLTVNNGAVVVETTEILNNTAGNRGGGIRVNGGTLTVKSSLIS
jgi:predicted outer membrane repeat protein